MTRFLLEIGDGWAFVGRQKRQKEIVIAGKTRRIDLLFYHIYLRCYVVIELKVKPFEPEFAGKLNFYVNAVNELICRDSDNPSIGLLICKDMDHTEVQNPTIVPKRTPINNSKIGVRSSLIDRLIK